jgi:uncharacterized membrane protein (UPF0182 family)
MNTSKFSSWFFLIAIFVVLIFLFNIVDFVTDWWWFSELGYSQIFIKSLGAKIGLGLVATVFAALFLFTNFSLAIRSKIPWLTTLPESLIGQPVNLDNRLVRKLAFAFSFVIALFFGLAAAASWQEVLKFLSATLFGTSDPVFGKEVAFYVFSLPVLKMALGLGRTLVFFTLTGCVLVYVLRRSFNLPDFIGGKDSQPDLSLIKKIEIKKEARLHLGILLFFFLATVAVGAYLSLFELLTSQSGLVFGAVYTDTAIKIPILWGLIFTATLAAVSAAVWGFSGRLAPFVGAVFLYIVVSLASGIIPALVQKLVVAPNELVKETPFIEHNIAATHQAFALDKIEEREILGDKAITAANISANNLTVKNVRLWDRQPLLSTFSQIQEIRTYYEFIEVDNDRYVIDGEIRQVMLSPRELASESLPNKNWINERLTFTHGYGVTAGPVNQVTPEGMPVLFVKDLPPQSEIEELEISQPEIYFGELSNDYVIAKTKSREFDYPKGEENVYTAYEGKGGVEINSLLKRLFYALRFKSLKLLLSNDITNESRILYYRNISERIAKIAPFLVFDQDPYIVIADGKIYWIADAYTVSNLYPYSQPLPLNGRNVNYIRNSVKVVVDAYNGRVVFYQADAEDPIINTYAKIFPQAFRPLSEIPESLIPHLRYPEDIFTLQTAIYTTYHMDSPRIFYNKEDQWEIPEVTREAAIRPDDKGPVMAPRHIIMKLPEEEEEEFILMLPFTPRAKDNLSAWMVARSDGENYGKLLVYRFPKDKLIFGPKQIIGRINQDAEISRQISLWDQRGSQVIQGPLLVIPIEESLIYVRPLYLKAEAGKIPELKRVIVAYENKIAMEETLEAGLSRIFGLATGVQQARTVETLPLPTQETQKLLKRAVEAYEAALRAQREGNWTRYGEEIRKLGEILKQ